MLFEEPTVEFVKIDTTDITAASCNLETSSANGSGEDCLGCDAEMNNCTDFFMNNIK